jgi:hypothetical protein
MSNDQATGVSARRLVRLANRVGIVPRLLVCSLLAILLAVAAGQTWTLRSVEANGLQRVQESLRISMAMLRHELEPLGTAWSTTSDGQLRSRRRASRIAKMAIRSRDFWTLAFARVTS